MAAQPLAVQVGVVPACQALGVSRATFYRRQRSTPGHQQPRPTPARALCEAEREQVLDVLAGPRFVDRAPAEVVATLLDEGHYLCSERTMYRILAADQPVRERRNQREHPQYAKPELVATAPNQTWSWDITKPVGADQVDVLLPLRRARYLQPLRGRLDGRRPGELGAGRSSHRRELPQTGRPAPGSGVPSADAARSRLENPSLNWFGRALSAHAQGDFERFDQVVQVKRLLRAPRADTVGEPRE